jgi:hypothetical protein
LISDTLDALNDSKVFTKLDLKSGYWAISMDKNSQEKTAFSSFMGLHEFKVMPFGLANAPANFQRYLQKVLNEYLWQFCLVYIDDVIVFSKNMDEHLDHLRKIFERIHSHNLRLNPEKCEFATEEVGYLGHIVSSSGIRPDPAKTKAIDEFPRPRKLRDVRSYLGLTSYYRRFVKGFAKIAKPLTQLLKKSQPFEWTDECEMAFQELRNKLIEPPIMAHFKPECPIILYTDSSDYAIGAILSQIQNGREVVISYNSKRLDERQMKFCVSEKECLAIIWAVQKLRQYLYGAKFTIRTDNCALSFLMKTKNPSGRLARWSLLLQAFDFEIEHRSGTSIRHCDCLSRYPVENADENLDEIDNLLLEEFNMAEEQRKDSWCSEIIKEIETNRNRKYISSYKITDGILYKVIYKGDQEVKYLLCVPKTLRLQILTELHDGQLSGHLGFLKTYIRVRERFYWKRIERSVRQYVRNCKSCQEVKHDNTLPRGNMQAIPYPSSPFELCGIDLVGRMPPTPRRNQFIIILIDFYSKYIEAAALKNTRSETIANFFVNQVITRHGAVEKVLTDRAPSFCSEFIEEVYKLTKSKHLTTTAYHPSCNGLVERAVRSIRAMMSHYINENHTNWDTYLHYLCFAYNTAVQSTTQESPYKLLYGREARLPIDVSFNLPKENKFGQKFKQSFEECKELVKFRVEDAQSKQKQDYDMRHFNVLFNRGDLVGLHVTRREVGKSEKLFKSYEGPFRILRKNGPVNYEIQSVEFPRRKPKIVHIQRLRRWHTGRIEGIEEVREPVRLKIDQEKSKSQKSLRNKSSEEKSKTIKEASKSDGGASDDLHSPKGSEASVEAGANSSDDYTSLDSSDKEETGKSTKIVGKSKTKRKRGKTGKGHLMKTKP